MKSRLIDAAAFAVGLIPAFLTLSRADEFAWPLRIAFSVLSPGYLLGLPIAQIFGMMGLMSFGFFFFLGILLNGLVFALISSLARNALRGSPAARLALGLGMGAWITWGAVYTVQAWPRPEHVAPVALASPLAGRWDGVLHGARGDRHVTLVCHPRADSTLDGYLYVHGQDMGPFEEGRCTDDSLSFGIVGFEYRAHVEGTRMDMTVTVSRLETAAELRYVSADTTRPARAGIDVETPLTGRWDGVHHVPSGDRAISLVFQPRTDGTLELYFNSNGAELREIWDASWSDDSLHFRLERIPYRAHFDSTGMEMEWVIEGKPRVMKLQRVSADTTRLYRPQPNRWIPPVGGGT